MNRVLLVGNALMALWLGFQLFGGGASDVAAAGSIGQALRPTVVRASSQALVVDFGHNVGPTDLAQGQPVDLGLRLAPDTDFVATWTSRRAVRLDAMRPLQPGRRYSLHLARPVGVGDNAVEAQVMTFETTGLSELRVVIENDDPASPVFLVAMDHEVDAEALRKALRLVDGAGAVLPFELKAAGFVDDQAFRVTLSGTAVPESVRFEVAPGLCCRGGDVATEELLAAEVDVRRPLHVAAVAFRGDDLRVNFSRSLGQADAAQLRIEPACDVSASADYNGVTFRGTFPPGQVVTVVVPAGFPGHGVARVVDEVRWPVVVPDRKPDLEIVGEGSVLSTLAQPELELRGVNLDSVVVSVRRVHDNNLVRYFERRDTATFGSFTQRKRDIVSARNEEFTDTMDLRELLGNEPRGIFDVWVRGRAQDRWVSARRALQITDLGVSVRSTGRTAAVQVVSLARGNPVANAAITVRSGTNQVLTQGRTGPDGTAIVQWPLPPAGPQHDIHGVHVVAGEDSAFVDLDSFRAETTAEALGGRAFLAAGRLEALVHFAAGIVRPGRTVHGTVLVRDGAGVAPAGRPLALTWRAPDGRNWRTQDVTLHGAGLLPVQLDTGLDTPTGRWVLEVRDGGSLLGRGAVRLETFVPDRLEAELAVEGELLMGATGEVVVRGRWLDGTPAAGQRVRLAPRFDFGPFAGPEGYVFGSSASGRGTQSAPPGALDPLEGVLDASGAVVFPLAVPHSERAATLRATLRAEVVDPSGRTVAARAVATAMRGDFHLGVLPADDGVDAVAVDRLGQPVAVPHAASLALEHRQWQTRRVRTGMDRWRYESNVVSELLAEMPLDLATGGTHVLFSVPDIDRGWLVWVARCAGAGGGTSAGAGGGNGDVPLRITEAVVGTVPAPPDRLRVDGGIAVRPGGVAQVSVQSPIAGRGFVTLETTQVRGVWSVDIAAGESVVPVPIPEDLTTTVAHVFVTLSRPQAVVGAEGPFWLTGGGAVDLDQSQRSTEVSLGVPDEVRPEERLSVDVVAPGALRATVAVVDVGILQVTAHRDPDPMAFFGARRRAVGRGAAIGVRLWDQVRFEPGVVTGGDDVDDLPSLQLQGSVDSRIKPLVLFEHVELDAEGRGVAVFDLPPYEGQVRVVALAGGARRVGASAEPVMVRAPLGVAVAGPRVAQPGDRFELPVTLTNRTKGDGTVHYDIDTVGGLALVDSDSGRSDSGRSDSGSVELRAGEARTDWIAVVAGPASSLDVAQGVKVSARLGDERRVVTHEFTVREVQPVRRKLEGLACDGEWSMRIGDEWHAEGLRLTIEAGPGTARVLRPTLSALLSYPYGCLEQTCSKGLALIACGALVPQIFDEDEVLPDVQLLTQAAVDRVVGMQLASGWFGWWSGSRPWSEGTVLATEFFVRARASGAAVPGEAIDMALRRVREVLRDRVELEVRAHALEVLALAGEPLQPWLDLMAEHARDEVRVDVRARIAWCLARSGMVDRAPALLDGDDAALHDARTEVMRSPLIARAQLLRAGWAIDPADSRWVALATQLRRELCTGGAHTTREQAEALGALAALHASTAGQREVQVAVHVDGVLVPVSDLGRAVVDVRPGSIVTLSSSAPVWGYTMVEGRRVDSGAAIEAGLHVSRRIFEAQSGGEVETLESGRLYRVEATLQASPGTEHVALLELLPGGLEPQADPTDGADDVRRSRGSDDALERRDDRVLWFRSAEMPELLTVTYHVRATLTGTWQWPAPHAEAMYDPSRIFTGGPPTTLEIWR